MSKGGARHFAKPTLGPGLVQKVLKNNREIIKDFGVYEHISTTGVVNPAGLLYCRMFLQDVLEISPTCMIASQPLRTALLGMLEKEPQLNCSKFNGSTWCSMKAERITVVLTHLRKVAREPSCKRVCASKLSGFENQQLLHLVSQVDIQDEQPKTGGKCLNRKASEASLDSSGFPKVFCSPPKLGLNRRTGAIASGSAGQGGQESLEKKAEEPLEKKAEKPLEKKAKEPLGEKAKGSKEPGESDSVPSLGEDLMKAMGYIGLKRPAAAKKALVTKAHPKKKALEKKACANKSGTKAAFAKKVGKGLAGEHVRKKWARLRVTHASKPERSYITGCHEGSSQLKLIVEVPRKWTTQYKKVIGIILNKLETEMLTKAEAIDLRAVLVDKCPTP